MLQYIIIEGNYQQKNVFFIGGFTSFINHSETLIVIVKKIKVSHFVNFVINETKNTHVNVFLLIQI